MRPYFAGRNENGFANIPIAAIGFAASTARRSATQWLRRFPAPETKRPAKRCSQTFVITGASSGFGRGVALKLAALQGDVVLAARRTDVLEELAAQIRMAGGSALVVTTDVSNPNEMQDLARAAIERFGRIDVWINNAAVGALGRFEDVPVEDHARIVDVNLKGMIYGSHAAMRQFRAQGFGTLVNVGSVESEIPLAYHASSAATKGGVINLGAAIAEEIRLSGSETINVATVMPGLWTHVSGNQFAFLVH
ncbi:SDR family NAD(P)-dependent oxidoreductase [Stutzerimonas stutzeri]|uniref:SDR family NAD(P)-dependent oxidoreductase n=1 Tax=Stutzerimonas stutzeri TaxID=316 RepID=UPI001E35A812|nr:SDR family NAD(P)-dependent oxidoreductase [Stutzerimonas stutzeri]